MPTKKLLGGAALVAALTGGGVAGALLGAPITSAAQEDSTTTTVDENTTTTTADDGGTTTDTETDEAEKECIGGPGFRHPLGREAFDAASDALGMTNAELREALDDGSTIAEVAEAEGVDLQTVIDAMVAAATERINQAVANDRLDQAEADELIAALPERMAELVQRELPPRRMGHGGRFGPHDDADADDDTSDSGDTTDTTDTTDANGDGS